MLRLKGTTAVFRFVRHGPAYFYVENGHMNQGMFRQPMHACIHERNAFSTRVNSLHLLNETIGLSNDVITKNIA